MREWFFLFAVSVSTLVGMGAGCGYPDALTVGRLDGQWGPGVVNPDAVRQKIIKRYAESSESDWRFDTAREMFRILSWEQATYVYRTSPEGVRAILLDELFGGREEAVRFHGMSRDQVIEKLGKPDAVWGDELIYTGEGAVSDSIPGYIFGFDSEGKVAGVTPGNG